MKEISIKPEVYSFDTFAAFAESFDLKETDLILTNEYIYKPYIEKLNLPCGCIYQEQYGMGEPSDTMAQAIVDEANKGSYDRVVAIGGGTIIDIAKILVLQCDNGIDALYDSMPNLVKKRELVIIPTTCGTGSEVTNIAIMNRTRLGTKQGLVSPVMYADYAILIPEFLNSLPYKVFATSSIDALIHAVESYLSPNATPTTEMFSRLAMEQILAGYCRIAENGQGARFDNNAVYLRASNYAGIAFSIAGCAAVHAMSYAFGGKYHVAHGESNYQFFTDVLYKYQEKQPKGKIQDLETYLAEVITRYGSAAEIEGKNGFEMLDSLLAIILPRKSMSTYGAVQEDIEPFAQSTIDNQQRLLKNNYVTLTKEDIAEIYQNRL
ncbi:MAG: 4-hydroxybutyrate dehydrogenase [Clostridiales bacterium]|nr:4-hydroxybutyrate dehydrogenase [Clostridiales bacterium]